MGSDSNSLHSNSLENSIGDRSIAGAVLPTHTPDQRASGGGRSWASCPRFADPPGRLLLQGLHKLGIAQCPAVQRGVRDGFLCIGGQPGAHQFGVGRLPRKRCVAQAPDQRMGRDAPIIGLTDEVTVTGPGVLPWVADHAGSHRVEVQVGHAGQQVPVCLDQS